MRQREKKGTENIVWCEQEKQRMVESHDETCQGRECRHGCGEGGSVVIWLQEQVSGSSHTWKFRFLDVPPHSLAPSCMVAGSVYCLPSVSVYHRA